jgi:Ferredoxin subunits of nitrite reductase and ring-hydroxylating dioxygenases
MSEELKQLEKLQHITHWIKLNDVIYPYWFAWKNKLLYTEGKEVLCELAEQMATFCELGMRTCSAALGTLPERIISDQILFASLGDVAKRFADTRLMLVNLYEKWTGKRLGLSKDASEVFNRMKEYADILEYLTSTKLIADFCYLAARVGFFYGGSRYFREVAVAYRQHYPIIHQVINRCLERYVEDVGGALPSIHSISLLMYVGFKTFPEEFTATKMVELEWVPVCNVDDLDSKKIIKSMVQGWLETLILKVNGRMYAIEGRCPHEWADLSIGRVTRAGRLTCADHYAVFDLSSGSVTTHPVIGSAKPLATFPVNVENGAVRIGIVARPEV